jgi:hypothetical protein
MKESVGLIFFKLMALSALEVVVPISKGEEDLQ